MTLTHDGPAAATPEGAGPPPPPKRRFVDRRFWTGFGAGLLAAILLFVGGSIVFFAIMMKRMESFGGAESMLEPPAFPGAEQRADYGLKLVSLDAKPLDPALLKGRVVFLNFWATWCAPCRAEMPSIRRLYEKAAAEDVIFVVASDESAETLSAFLKDFPYALPIYRLEGKRPAAYETNGIPATFILAPDGRIVFRHVGAVRWDHEDTVAFLRSLRPSRPAARK